jgi:hypothetical protein
MVEAFLIGGTLVYLGVMCVQDTRAGIGVVLLGIVAAALVGSSTADAQVRVKAGENEPGESMSLLFNNEFHSCRPVFGAGLISIFEVEETDASLVTTQVLAWSLPNCEGKILSVSEPWVRGDQNGNQWAVYTPEPEGGEFWALAALTGVAARRRTWL